MTREKEDLRVTKTKKSLRNAILDLSAEKSIEKVSVIDICDTALVNRMTFYKYYQDKFELFHDAIQYSKQEILADVQMVDDNTREGALANAKSVLDSIYRYYMEHRKMISGITKFSGPVLSAAIAETGMAALTKAFELKEGNLSSKYPADLIASCVYGGFIGLIEYSLKNPTKYTADSVKNYLASLEVDVLDRNYNLI